MPYLDQYSKAKKTSRRIPKQHAQSLVMAVMDLLADWRFSPFENEGGTRHALRNYFIQRGQAWPVSDDHAAALIAEAFDRKGIKRPSWLEGQWQYTAPREECVWCAGAISEEDQMRSKRFCSSVCARASFEKRSEKGRTRENWFYQRALVEIAHHNAPPIPCKHCGEMFKNRFKSRQFCSRKCHDAHRRAPDIACRECKTMFHPQDHSKKYCCHPCAVAGAKRDREAIQLPPRMCPCCVTVFRPKADRAIYCSTRCARIMANRAYRSRQKQPAENNVIYLTTEIFDSWFRVAA